MRHLSSRAQSSTRHNNAAFTFVYCRFVLLFLAFYYTVTRLHIYMCVNCVKPRGYTKRSFAVLDFSYSDVNARARIYGCMEMLRILLDYLLDIL